MEWKTHLRHCLLWLFDKDNSISSVEASKQLKEVYPDQGRKSIQDWIDSKPAGFWVMGFTDLPNRWEKVIEYDGDYFPED